MQQVIPYMRLVKDDGNVILPAIENGELKLLEAPCNHPIHEQMHLQNKFSRIIFADENQSQEEIEEVSQDQETQQEEKEHPMQLLQSEVTEEQLSQVQIIDRVTAGRMLTRIGHRLVQSSHYDTGEIQEIEAELNNALDLIKKSEVFSV